MPTSLLRSGFWTVHFLGLAVAAFWLAWWLLTPVDFGFRLGYQWLDIDAHIREFGPQNMYKHGYELTTDEQRFAHFRAIATAINAGGEGLAAITYQVEGRAPEALLRDAEVVHLQDVAVLVTGFHWAGPILLLLWLGTAAWAKHRRWTLPPARQLLLGAAVLIVVCAGILLLMGPTAVFYWLHTRIFPEDHQWFFYYQESLMTTLMKAPDLFGLIAVFWVGLSLVLIALVVSAQRKWLS